MLAAIKPSKKAPLPADHELGARIRSHRERLGLSQEALARVIGLTFQQVQKYEKGVNRISAGRLTQIAGAFGMSVSTLLGEGSGSGAMRDFMELPDAQEVARIWCALTPELRAQSLATLRAALP